MANRAASYILIGAGREYDDYGSLQLLSEDKRDWLRWSCTSSVREGDMLFFYIVDPFSAIVAQGRALKNAKRSTSSHDWKYTTEIGEVRMLGLPLTLEEIKVLFPDWTKWRRPQGSGWRIPERFISGLRSRAKSLKPSEKLLRLISKGGGFGSPDANRRVERAAVRAVKKHFVNDGWKLTSVEKEKRGYDLVASKQGKKKHIEVKGVAGQIPTFIITKNEVDAATLNKDFLLAVVTSALVPKELKIHKFNGKGFTANFELNPLSFFARKR